MADEKDNKEKKDSKESKAASKETAANPDTGKKAAAKKEPKEKPAAKKEPKEKPAKKPAAKPDVAKPDKEKSAPKADKADKAPKADKDEKPAEEKKPRRKALAKKGAKKADEKPAKKAPKSDEVPVVRASARYVRIAPRKARLIADQVRGMHIEQARALLSFSPRGAAEDIHKLINSAAANAENNHDLIGDEMRISSITVDEGPTLRRFRPRALGRATPINKRTSHIAVALTPVED
jgi:ribosomal protein L22